VGFYEGVSEYLTDLSLPEVSASSGRPLHESSTLAPGERLGDKATPLLSIRIFRGGSSGFHVQVGSVGFPVVADLGEDGGSEPQERRPALKQGRIEGSDLRKPVGFSGDTAIQ